MTDHRANGKRHARLFRIWQVGNAAAWNITAAEISAQLGDMSTKQVAETAKRVGWHRRMRHTSVDLINVHHSAGIMYSGFDGPTSLQKGDGVGGV